MAELLKTYSELIRIPSFIERYRYLKLGGVVGRETFGQNRYLNQILYNSGEWRSFRNQIINRDNGCDLGVHGFDGSDMFIVHHINPLTLEDVVNRDPCVFDPDNVITVTPTTHRAIHYGDESILVMLPIERTPYDTCPWRK